MKTNYTNATLLTEINKQIEVLGQATKINIEIWETDRNILKLIIMISNGYPIKFNNAKTISVAELNTEEESARILQKEGQRIKQYVKRHYPNIKVTSELYI